MVVLLVLAALAGGALGAVMLSQATMGVGFICGGCLAAILARVWQADAHHKAIRAMLEKR